MPAGAREAAVASPSDAWTDVWRNLELLARRAPGSPEFRALAGELEHFADQREEPARKQRDRVERFRVRVLRAQLARLAGMPWTPIQEPVVEIPWMPGEAWIAAQVLLAGTVRDRALLHVLDQDGAQLSPEWRPVASAALREASLAARVADAEALATALDQRWPSAASARDLARVHALAGDRGRARALLEERLALARAPAEERQLLATLGEIELSTPAAPSASQHLGSALARGSTVAGLLLARRAFDAGEIARARCLYRALIALAASGSEGDGPQDLHQRAARGWGLACLTHDPLANATDPSGAP